MILSVIPYLSRFFEYLIVLIILLNSITLALYDYSDRDSTTRNNQILDLVNKAFSGLFILEAVLKVVA